MSYGEGLGIAPLAIASGVSLVSKLGSIFSSSGPDDGKWKNRVHDIQLAIQTAEAGNIDGLYYLGAVSGVPLPRDINIPGLADDGDDIIQKGWKSKWGGSGGAYNELISAAGQAYATLKPRFVAQPTVSQPTASSPSTTMYGTPTAPSPALASMMGVPMDKNMLMMLIGVGAAILIAKSAERK